MGKKLKTHYKIFFFTIFLLLFLLIVTSADFSSQDETTWGVTFSKKYAEELNLSWRELYLLILQELKFKKIRLPVYWDDVEKNSGSYDFTDYDWLVEQAQKNGTEIILVVGRRVPRWPECHEPNWVKNNSEEVKQKEILKLVKQEVEHFKKFTNIKIWQVDNEPFLASFGECPKPDMDFIKREIDLVRSIDDRPVMVTESGELSTWLKGSRIADYLGISMYRATWNKYWGNFYYPLPPAYYYFKSRLISFLTPVKSIINTELQVEPWVKSGDVTNEPLVEQFYNMDLMSIKNNLDFARRTGINEIYVWGVEWWYWLKKTQNHPEFWELGKTLNNP